MKRERIDLGGGAWVDHALEWLSPAEAGAMMRSLREELHWEERKVLLFGRWVRQPRLVAWAGDVAYRYSGQTLPPRAWTETAARVLERVIVDGEANFNHMLANRYRDGSDSMGLHADDEVELGVDPTVASVSFGQARRFVVRGRRGDAPSFDLPLAHGTLLVMGGTFQRVFRHGIPKEPEADGERISLTFREIRRDPEEAAVGGSLVGYRNFRLR